MSTIAQFFTSPSSGGGMLPPKSLSSAKVASITNPMSYPNTYASKNTNGETTVVNISGKGVLTGVFAVGTMQCSSTARIVLDGIQIANVTAPASGTVAPWVTVAAAAGNLALSYDSAAWTAQPASFICDDILVFNTSLTIYYGHLWNNGGTNNYTSIYYSYYLT